MKTKRKIWLGVGAFVVAGTGAIGAPLAAEMPSIDGFRSSSGLATDTAIPRARSGGVVFAQHVDHGKEAGEGGWIEKASQICRPISLSGCGSHCCAAISSSATNWSSRSSGTRRCRISCIRSRNSTTICAHRSPITKYRLSTMRSKRSPTWSRPRTATTMPRALKAVSDALAAVDAAMTEKQADWPGFVAEAAIEVDQDRGGRIRERAG